MLAGAPDPDAMYEKVIFPTKLKLQLYYLDTRSFWGDLKIILYTALRIVRKNWTPRELRLLPDVRATAGGGGKDSGGEDSDKQTLTQTDKTDGTDNIMTTTPQRARSRFSTIRTFSSPTRRG